MPFQVYLSPTTASPPDAQVRADVRAAIIADGGKIDGDGLVAEMSDGLKIKFAGDPEHFLVDQLSPSLCRVLFNAALKSNSTVDRGGSDVIPLKMKGAKGSTRYIRMRTDLISDSAALCARLERDRQDWNKFIADAESKGIMDADEHIIEPLASPGTEPRLSSDPSGVAAYCEAAQERYAKFGWKIVHKVVSQNPQYGVVWRADVTIPQYRDIPSRVICWKRPGHTEYGFVNRPLKMFDPALSAPPLGP